MFQGVYRGLFLETLNGSARDELTSDHLVHFVRLRAELPFRYRGWAAGVDYELYVRRSDFEADDILLVHQESDLLQALVSWRPGS